ncbi:MAG: hypothetical protein IKO75_01865 [Bacteroidales bacterium]|jgi:hypothetical protein|nr:hypothetical protein [Bacteroidales bacterium]
MATIALTTNNQTKLDLLIALAKELRVKCIEMTEQDSYPEIDKSMSEIDEGNVHHFASFEDFENKMQELCTK